MIKAFVLLSWLIFHPVHVTITSIEYIKEENSYSVFLKMYHDDFLLDMEKNNIDSGMNISAEIGTLHKDIVNTYLGKNFLIFENQKQLTGQISNMKIIDGEVMVYLNFKSERKPDSLTVRSLIMTGLYSDQANLMIVKVNNFEEGVKLTPEKTEQTFILN
jgi:hypothetical protein